MAFTGSIVLLFLVAGVVALAAKRLRLPYTVALVVAGLVLGSTKVISPPVLTKELLFALFLPGLIFEAAFHLEAEEFWRNRLPIFSLAVPGVAGATVVCAVALMFGLDAVNSPVTWGAAFVFATLIAATDPIAVVALVRTLGAPPRLGLLIEGESLLNDGTAAAALSITLVYVLGTGPVTASLFIDFVYVIGAGVIVGGVIGLVASRIVEFLDDAMLMITVTMTAAYGSFLIGESLHASGVIATVTAGLLCGNRSSQQAMSPSMRSAVGTFWEYLAFALNSLVFLLIGFQAGVPTLLANWKPILVAYVVVTVGRTAVTYALAAALPRHERLPWRWTAVLAWAGLRGSLAMVLALSLPPAMPQRELIVAMTFGVVVLSILVQGLTVSPLMRWLKLGTSLELRASYEKTRAELMTARAAVEELDRMEATHVAAPHVHEQLAAEYRERIDAIEARLKDLHSHARTIPGEELDRARRHLLAIERNRVMDAFRLGSLSESVRDRLIADIDARWARSEIEATPSHDEAPYRASEMRLLAVDDASGKPGN